MASAHSGPAATRLHGWAHRHPGMFRIALNHWPAVRGTGGRVTRIAPDWSEMALDIPMSRRTRNYVGTIFGGSLYAAADPHFMFLLMHALGPEYLVWDKAASIRFRRPARTTLHATFRLPPGEADEVRRLVAQQGKVDRTYAVDLVDAEGVPHATLEKVLNVRRASDATTPGRPRAAGPASRP